MAKDFNPTIKDPILTFANIPVRGRNIELQLGKKNFPHGGHFQGIQFFNHEQNGEICYLTRRSDKQAYLVLVEKNKKAEQFCTIQKILEYPSDGYIPPLRHPGGFQIIGDFMVVGVEDDQEKMRSQIQFWDLSEPLQPILKTPLTVFRNSKSKKEKTAGAVGICKRKSDHLLAVGNWHSSTVDFYRSNGYPLNDDRCRFEDKPIIRWDKDKANTKDWKPNRRWGTYQSINLFADDSYNIYMVGFNRFWRRDFADLFVVDIRKPTKKMIQKLDNKHMKLKGGATFLHAGGLLIKSSQELQFYSCGKGNRPGSWPERGFGPRSSTCSFASR